MTIDQIALLARYSSQERFRLSFVSSGTFSKITLDYSMRCSRMRVGRVSLIVLLICSLGVRISTRFSVLAICVFSCLESGKERSSLVKMLRMCREGTGQARSLTRLTATSCEALSPNILRRVLVTLLAMLLGMASMRSIPFHLRQNSLNLVGIFSASSFTYPSSSRIDSSLRIRFRQKLTTSASSKLNISSTTSMNFVPRPKIVFTYSYELLYFSIFIARNLRIIRWDRYSLSYNRSSQRTKISPISECWSISVIFSMMPRMVSKCRLSLSMPIRMFSRFSFRKFLGYWAALCYHSIIQCQMGLPNFTTWMMKLRTAFVLLVITSDIVCSFLFAYCSAISKANSQCSSLFSTTLATAASVWSRLMRMRAYKSAWVGFLGKLFSKMVNKSLKYLSSVAFQQRWLMSMRMGCLMTGSARIFLAMTLRSLSPKGILTSLAIIFSSMHPYMSRLRLKYSRFSKARQQFITSLTLSSKSMPLKISPYRSTFVSSFRYSFISISNSRSSCDS